MQLPLPGRPHLTYCTNVHPGETWAEIYAALQEYLPRVKERISPNEPMGVGLRLSAIAARELSSPEKITNFKEFLEEHDLYVFTVNAFPYGPFHGRRVKEKVYDPDWLTTDRLSFTIAVANILAELLPAGVQGSISTVPGAFRTSIKTDDDIARMTGALLKAAFHVFQLERQTGRAIILALEPEPACFLETTEEAITFFECHLFSPSSVEQFSALSGLSQSEAAEALRRHLGLCLDVCHAAVAFEDIATVLAYANRAGISVAKLQLSAALKITDVVPEIETVLSRFDDGIYLHQTVQSRHGALTRHLDLGDAFAALRAGDAGGEWRVHCHVPVFMDAFENVQSTQSALQDVLQLCRTRKIAPHLEVETYTWGVLPATFRNADLGDDIAREIKWVCRELGL